MCSGGVRWARSAVTDAWIVQLMCVLERSCQTCRILSSRSSGSGPQRWDRWWAKSRCRTQSPGCRTRGTRSPRTPRHDTDWQRERERERRPNGSSTSVPDKWLLMWRLLVLNLIPQFRPCCLLVDNNFFFFKKCSVPGNDEKRGSQEAEAKITESQVDGHELWRSELLSLPAVD